MNLKWNLGRLASLAVALLAVTACGGGGSAGGSSGDGGGNLLQEIKDRGVLRASTDPAYPPQSFLNEQGEFEGFDIDVTEEIAKRMGVEVEWMTPGWDVITAGSWNGRWDLSVGSMTITPDRAEVLYFTPAYYYTPAATAVHESNTHHQPGDRTAAASGGWHPPTTSSIWTARSTSRRLESSWTIRSKRPTRTIPWPSGLDSARIRLTRRCPPDQPRGGQGLGTPIRSSATPL